MRIFVFTLMVVPMWGQPTNWQAGVAQVSAKGQNPGTGFVVAVRPGRVYVVTGARVVEGDKYPSVTFNADAESQRYQSEVRDSNRRSDLALLVVDKPPSGVRVIEPSLESPSQGTPALIAGYPSETGAKFTVLRGAIASVSGTEILVSPGTEAGFSGGPVLTDGRVIGVVFEHMRSFDKAIRSGIVDLYLRGLEVQWGTDSRKAEERAAESASASRRVAGAVRTNAKDGLNYVWIPPGSYLMGCSPGDIECRDDEKPAREVMLSRGFWMGQTEVTQAAYERVMGETPSLYKGGQHPVERVDWEEAGAYCGKVGMRLPTEVEWEYAARAGDPNARHGELGSVAWHVKNSNGKTHEVARRQANGWGLYDMLGNVNEWTSDLYPNSARRLHWRISDVLEPDPNLIFRVVRGGSSSEAPENIRVSYRFGYISFKYHEVGFRCAGSLP